MSLTLPQLDDRTYGDLVAEARALIPGLFPEWTDHNPADSGITLIELFCWLTEMLIYRVDRVPDAHRRAFLKLLNGPHWQPGLDIEEDVRTTIAGLRRRFRAVTPEDYEALAREAPPGAETSASVARARCVPRRDLAASTEAGRLEARAGHVGVIVLEPTQPGSTPPQTSEALLQAVHHHLEERRLLTTCLHVVGPVWAPVEAEILFARRPDAPEADVEDRVLEALRLFLDPLTGGPEGTGWPFGRAVYVSELNELLEGVPGVDFVSDLDLASTARPEDGSRTVAASRQWHDGGDLIGLEIGPHHLPWLRLSQIRLVSGAAFVAVRLSISVSLAPSVERRRALQTVKRRVREVFNPLHNGQEPGEPWVITAEEIRSRILELGEIADVREIVERQGAVATFRLEAGELADVQATVEIVEPVF